MDQFIYYKKNIFVHKLIIIYKVMAEFKIDGRMKVKTLKETFKESFGGTLRVYVGNRKADENATIASIREEGKPAGGMVVAKSWYVETFENKMLEEYGIKVQVFTCDDWVAVLDGIKLEDVGKIKKGATKADMVSFVTKK